MPICVRTAAVVLQLLTVAVAQTAGELPRPITKAPVFTLPAGQHGLAELVNLLGQIRNCEIDCAAAELDAVDNQKVLLQRELQLAAPEFEDVVTTVLFYRGLVVVPDQRAGRQRAIAMRDRVRLHDSAVARTAAELLARPSRIEFATTILRTDPSEIMQRKNVLCLLVSSMGSPHPVTVQDVDGGMQLTGSTEQLAHALKAIGLLDGVQPEPAPAIGWPAGTLPWPGGKMRLTKFLAAFSSNLNANLIGSPDGREVDLGAAEQLSAAQWWSRATVVLRSVDHAIVPVVPSSRVFLLRELNDRGAKEIYWRAAFEAPEAVLQAAAIEPVMTLHECKHISIDVAMRIVRPPVGKRASTLTVARTGPTGLLFVGLRDDVAQAVQSLREADQPK